jgi:DNA-binding CsgD family transcriptional regulator
MTEIARSAQGGVVESIHGHARALADRDPARLIAAAERLATVGLLAGAVDAASQAAAFARSAGKAELARKASVLAAQWNSGLTGYRPSVVGERSDELTEREWVVALAAAGRARSKEIAAQLGVSARTVDNHLTNIYRKLGVSSRDELRVELAGMTAPD